MLSLYLAGPGVFLYDPQTYFDKKKEICTKYNFVGISPIDINLDPSKFTPFEFGHKISKNNEGLMHTCDAGIFDMTPYHGVSMDVGTAFEMGFMRALNKPIFAYSNDSRKFYDRVTEELGNINGTDKLGRSQVNGFAVENFDMHDNLMLDGALESSNSKVFTYQAGPCEKYVSLKSFENAVEHAAKKLYGEK